jgi:hypothetical protein
MPQAILQIDERQRLTQVVAELYEFSVGDPRDRHALISAAGLRRFLPAIDLKGMPRTVAIELIDRLEGFGVLPDRPTYHALGALLGYLLTLGDLPRDAASFVARLIVQYSLVADPVYSGKLCTEFGITDDVVRQPTPKHAPSPSAVRKTPSGPASAIPLGDEAARVIDLIEKLGLEMVIPSEDNLLDIHSLAGAIYSAQAVCQVDLPTIGVSTGFLIGPDLVLTTGHLFRDPILLKRASVTFDYRLDAAGVTQPGRVFPLKPDFYYSSLADELDYALVRLAGQPLGERMLGEVELGDLSMWDLLRMGKHRGYLALAPRFIGEYDRVNIIQHPGGDPMKVVMTQNYVTADMSQTRVQYVANTEPGSAGAPVFNQNWEVVALHNSGMVYSLESLEVVKTWKGSFVKINEGIPMRAILEDFKEKGIDRYLP